MLETDVTARIESQVAALNHRVKTALDLAELIRQGAVPNFTPAAFVVPGGYRPADAGMGTNAYVQELEERLAIILVVRSAGDVSGAKTQPELKTLIQAIIVALAGHQPGGESAEDEDAPFYQTGVLVFDGAELIELTAGAVFYRLDFKIDQQLRILG
jgi:hypothetical protein